MSINYHKKGRTYIIWAPPYEKSNGVRSLYKLCEELQNHGYDSYIFSSYSDIPKVRFVKKITPNMRKNAIIVYPEALPGNPLNFSNVVRWVLYYPGVIGGDEKYDENELIFTWLKDYYNAPTLQVQHLNHDLFYYDKNVEKNTNSYFVYKGGQCRDLPELKDAVKITFDWPETREELADLLKRTNVLYSFDPKTALNDEALLCGCKVKIVTENNIYNHDCIDEISKEEFEKQFDNFIRLTQHFYNHNTKPLYQKLFFIQKTDRHVIYTLFGIKLKLRRKNAK